MFHELEKLRDYATGDRAGNPPISLLADAAGEIVSLRARVAGLERAGAEAMEWNWLSDDADETIPSWIAETLKPKPQPEAVQGEPGMDFIRHKCPHCGRMMPVNKTGMLRVHSNPTSVCPPVRVYEVTDSTLRAPIEALEFRISTALVNLETHRHDMPPFAARAIADALKG